MSKQYNKIARKAYKRIARNHLIVPDCQVRPGVPLDHLDWIGNYIEEKRPDVIVQIGDFADLPSLSTYNTNLEKEGLRYRDDLLIVREAMHRLTKPWKKLKGYKPLQILTLGNHEDRIRREIEEHPRLAGVIGGADLGYEDFGWSVKPFLKPTRIDDIEYCHYFVSGAMGRPVSSARALLTARHRSAVMGHVQTTDVAFHQRSGHIGIFCGICYLHDEKYLNPQGNVTRRQVVMLHEVRDGTGDPMFVSLEFLKRRYS